ncbi:Polyphenol oxidase [Candidatus Hepatincola sp. Pdp]
MQQTLFSAKAPLLKNLPHIKHAFFGRQGGYSKGLFASLNTSLRVPDSPKAVLKNREIISKYFNLPPTKLLTFHQIHSNRIIFVENNSNFKASNKIEADGMVTNHSGIILSIITADCLPILFAHQTKPLIAAIHCGWPGLTNGIIENTIHNFKAMGCKTEDLIVAIGPCIHQESYEVDLTFYNNFLQLNNSYKKFFIALNNKKFLFNLPECATNILIKNNILVKNINVLPYNTYKEEQLFFSHRRATHKKEVSRGLQLSCISLIENIV